MADDADRAQAVLERHPVRPPPVRSHRARHSDRCLECGALISLIRLRAMPTASRCLDCQTAWEHGHGR